MQNDGQGTGGGCGYIGGGSETAAGRNGGAARGAAFRVRSVRNVIEREEEKILWKAVDLHVI